MLTWYVPTMRGDINLQALDGGHTRLTAKELSPTEREAVAQLAGRTYGWFKRWVPTDDYTRAMAAFENGDPLQLDLNAPIEMVQAVLARTLKPGRRLLSVALVGDSVQEVWRSEEGIVPKALTPYRGEAPPPAQDKPAPVVETKPELEEGKPLPAAPTDTLPDPPPADTKKAVTVAQPVLGCPAPDFPDNPVTRANRVLEAFLNPEQIADYRHYGAFVTRGFDTGRHYALTSRDARSLLRQRGGRTLFNIDERISYCVHDWDVPPAEELLALHCFLAVPGGESYITRILQPGAFRM